MNKPLMKCGHTANATTVVDGVEIPCCAICAGIVDGAYEIDDNAPSLEGRTAKCSYCDREVPSDYNLPFFEHKPNCKHDSYYCGCMGWN